VASSHDRFSAYMMLEAPRRDLHIQSPVWNLCIFGTCAYAESVHVRVCAFATLALAPSQDQFYSHMMLEAPRRDLRAIIENKSRIVLVHSSSGYKHALKEVLADPAVALRIQDTKAAREVHEASLAPPSCTHHCSTKNAVLRCTVHLRTVPSVDFMIGSDLSDLVFLFFLTAHSSCSLLRMLLCHAHGDCALAGEGSPGVLHSARKCKYA